MEQRVAIVTGGLRGLGRAMTFGLAREGHHVLAVGHIDADIATVEAETAAAKPRGQILPLVADLRRPADCDRVVAIAVSRFGGVHILVNSAGLTFTTIDPARFRRAEPQKFWQVPDDIVRAVIETNYIAADQMARRVAPLMVEQGWGRIVNVTTKLDTMNRPHTSPYGASKAALEMATEVWAKEVEGTGLTINIVEFVEPAATAVFRRSLVDVLCVSSFVLTNSKFVAADVSRYLATRMNFQLPVIPITLATELNYRKIETANISQEYKELATEDYVLCVGTIEIRKNHMYLVEIWERLIRQFQGPVPNLVFVGKWGWEIAALQKYLQGSDYLGGRLHIYDGIPDGELTFLYQNCLFTIYPSFAEGWGLPVGESLSHGKPCIASNATAVPEVGRALWQVPRPV